VAGEARPMTKRDGVILGSRLLAVLLTVWTLSELSYLPSHLLAYLRYAEMGYSSSPLANQYWKHHYLIELGFLITRIVGYSLMAAWLYKCGPDIEELLLPTYLQEDTRH
jgi:hypothetical protein